jgi:hypothetical protein
MKKSVITVLMIFFALIVAAGEVMSAKFENTNEPFTFHGRLSIGNGTPCYRIWIVATRRILGVGGGDLEPAEMPQALQSVFSNTSVEVYADFAVTPLTKYEKGVMQMVRVDATSNLVIYVNGQYSGKKSKI